MANKLGKIQATPAPAAAGTDKEKEADNSLPDPTSYARHLLLALLLLSVAISVVLNAVGLTSNEFKPTQMATANFALFAAFYVAAQVIERLMELISPLLPWWSMPASITERACRAAKVSGSAPSGAKKYGSISIG